MSSVSNTPFDCCSRHQITKNLGNNSNLEKTASTVGTKVSELEEEYAKLVSSENPNAGDVMKLENKIKRAYMSLESLGRIMQNRFQIMMQGIRALSIR